MLEQEVKLRFEHDEAARQAVTAAGGCLAVPSRLIDDRLYDTTDARLTKAGATLRLRRDGYGPRAFLTFKGPLQTSEVKVREEVETSVGSADAVEAMLGLLGFVPTFRAQKYREEYLIGQARVAVDRVPFGAFVEIEAVADEIARVSALLGRSNADYCLDSYPDLWRQWCRERGLSARDMLVDRRTPTR